MNTDEKSDLEKSLEEAQIRFDLIEKSSSEGLWDMKYPADGQLNPDTPFWWSDHFRSLLGFTSVQDFPNILDSWGSRLHPEDKDQTFAAFTAHLTDKTGNTPYDLEYRLRMKSDDFRWFRARGCTLRDPEGNPLRVAGSLKDITNEKIREEELQTAIIRFDLVNKSSSEGLWDMKYPADGQLNPDTPFWWSDHFRTLLGFSNEQDFPNILDSWGSRLHPEDKERAFTAFAAHLTDKTGNTPYDLDYRLRMKNGEYKWFHAGGFTLRDPRGNPLRVAGSLKDINNEKIKNIENASMMAEINAVIEALVQGDLSRRADVSGYTGDNQKVMSGLNQMLDAILIPVDEATRILVQIRGGDLREKIEISCRGDHEKMKNAVNGVHAWLSELIQFVTCLSKGDMTAHMGMASDNDQIHEHLIRLRGNIQALVADVQLIAQAAVEGKLQTRADATKHQGDFSRIVTGINNTLDSVVIPVNEALRVSKSYANYQFKTRVDTSIRAEGDWIEFRNALDNIGVQISEAVNLINHQLDDLTSYAQEAATSIEGISVGAQQIARSAGGVSRNAELGNDGIAQVLKAMEDLNITVSEVSQRAEQVSAAAIQANEFSKNGIELARDSESSMNEISRSTREVDVIVKEINDQMDEIGKIVRLISDIANQTNLLALNAAIEAARAGEAGRGFAVVAAEVKSLAQDSRKSAENIADMITTLQNKAQKATIAMAQAGSVVETGGKTLTETVGAFHQIAKSIEDITRNAMDVASSSEEQAASVEEVTASITEVSELIINTSKESADAAAATKEASVSIDQISTVVKNVSGIVDSVSQEMAKFVV